MIWKPLAILSLSVLVIVAWFSAQPQATADLPTDSIRQFDDGMNQMLPVADNEAKNLAKKIAGTWYSFTTPPGGVPLLVVFHYTENGSTFGSSTTEGGGNFGQKPFSNSHGSWEQIGPRKIRSTDVVFSYAQDQNGGTWDATYKIVVEREFDKDFQTSTGVQINYQYAPGDNPFDPDVVPVACYGFGESVAYRVPVDDLPDECPDPPGCSPFAALCTRP